MISRILQKYQRSGESFTADAFGRDRLNLLADYFLKDVVEAEDRQLNSIREKNITHVGLSIDPNLLPENQGMDRALPAAE